MSNEEQRNLAGLISLITELQKTIQILTAKLDKYEKLNGNLSDVQPTAAATPVVPMPGTATGNGYMSGFNFGQDAATNLNLNPNASSFEWRDYPSVLLFLATRVFK